MTKYIIDTQATFFGKYGFSINYPHSIEIPSEFYEKGYTVLKNIPSREDAIEIGHEFISSLFKEKKLFYTEILPMVEVAKTDNIPVCLPFIEGNYQALHFDYGFPILPDKPQNTYTLTILYYPHSTLNQSEAITRIVGLEKLLSQKKWFNRNIVAKAILDYTNNHGDGWTEPDAYNTGRIACFARLIDALNGKKELSQDIDKSSADFFKNHPSSLSQIASEQNYYLNNGYNISKVEENIILGKGDLLLIDNIRTIHGRSGSRVEKEIFQAIYGIEKTKPEHIFLLRDYLFNLFSTN